MDYRKARSVPPYIAVKKHIRRQKRAVDVPFFNQRNQIRIAPNLFSGRPAGKPQRDEKWLWRMDDCQPYSESYDPSLRIIDIKTRDEGAGYEEEEDHDSTHKKLF